MKMLAFVVVRDQFTWAKAVASVLEGAGCLVYMADCGSTYPATLGLLNVPSPGRGLLRAPRGEEFASVADMVTGPRGLQIVKDILGDRKDELVQDKYIVALQDVDLSLGPDAVDMMAWLLDRDSTLASVSVAPTACDHNLPWQDYEFAAEAELEMIAARGKTMAEGRYRPPDGEEEDTSYFCLYEEVPNITLPFSMLRVEGGHVRGVFDSGNVGAVYRPWSLPMGYVFMNEETLYYYYCAGNAAGPWVARTRDVIVARMLRVCEFQGLHDATAGRTK